MATTLKALAQKMRGMDYCLLTTVSSHGQLASRPMSNNGEVEYDGTSYFFTWADSRAARDIEKNSHVVLNFKAKKGFLFVAVQGHARVLHDRRVMKDHWHPELERWFKGGLDTEGLVMLVVDARRIQWWGEEDGKIELKPD
ncbi:pyridoxamine 5'-phosphate oxidase family protein [Deinococcus arcticus]|uniref:Pyridoxamine 5'-phosphate oxidase n=1 Tax=Deinococcus arcticus TaxID=2136176 RepID=A0A2T3W7Z1_9DEIO|nr:pyridoxamine 5'-phosphate oxidase family protein [Deinococcus arcticus]PTA68009.1 pyridoxamine 5'-phosphate oxidase [Deinococcus arcticus]